MTVLSGSISPQMGGAIRVPIDTFLIVRKISDIRCAIPGRRVGLNRFALSGTTTSPRHPGLVPGP